MQEVCSKASTITVSAADFDITVVKPGECVAEGCQTTAHTAEGCQTTAHTAEGCRTKTHSRGLPDQNSHSRGLPDQNSQQTVARPKLTQQRVAGPKLKQQRVAGPKLTQWRRRRTWGRAQGCTPSAPACWSQTSAWARGCPDWGSPRPPPRHLPQCGDSSGWQAACTHTTPTVNDAQTTTVNDAHTTVSDAHTSQWCTRNSQWCTHNNNDAHRQQQSMMHTDKTKWRWMNNVSLLKRRLCLNVHFH